MILGIWKNIYELEESINLDELQCLLTAVREREHRQFKAMAAVQGIDIDEGKQEQREEDPVERIKMEIEAQKRGVTKDFLEMQMLGFETETEDE